eukprot:751162-Hanusia_phi.AAC.1
MPVSSLSLAQALTLAVLAAMVGTGGTLCSAASMAERGGMDSRSSERAGRMERMPAAGGLGSSLSSQEKRDGEEGGAQEGGAGGEWEEPGEAEKTSGGGEEVKREEAGKEVSSDGGKMRDRSEDGMLSEGPGKETGLLGRVRGSLQSAMKILGRPGGSDGSETSRGRSVLGRLMHQVLSSLNLSGASKEKEKEMEILRIKIVLRGQNLMQVIEEAKEGGRRWGK